MTQDEFDIVVLWVDGSDPEFIRENKLWLVKLRIWTKEVMETALSWLWHF